ncbi:MAG: hypothetical protein ACXWUB_10020, partial [Burkholderiales bacterium]
DVAIGIEKMMAASFMEAPSFAWASSLYRPQKFHRYARAHSYFVAFKALIAEIEEAKPGDDPFDAKVTVLGNM